MIQHYAIYNYNGNLALLVNDEDIGRVREIISSKKQKAGIVKISLEQYEEFRKVRVNRLMEIYDETLVEKALSG